MKIPFLSEYIGGISRGGYLSTLQKVVTGPSDAINVIKVLLLCHILAHTLN